MYSSEASSSFYSTESYLFKYSPSDRQNKSSVFEGIIVIYELNCLMINFPI
jgi:hypothetical protein